MTVNDAARQWLANHGWVVVETDDGPDGRLNRDSVQIRRDMDPKHELLVLLHEMAHILLRHAEEMQRPFNRHAENRREVTAETAAGAAARLLGVDATAEVAEYLAQYPNVQPERNAGMTGRLIADGIKVIMR